MTILDFLKALGSCLFLIGLALTWVHCSGQTAVDRTLRRSLRIVDRIILIHIVTIGVVCWWMRCPIDYLGIALVYLLLVLPIASLEIGPIFADGPLGLALGIMAIGPVYVLKQFVLGFPDRDAFILQPPALDNRGQQEDSLAEKRFATSLNGATAVVVTPLRPYGTIQVDDQRISAVSVDGSLVDAGTIVRIHGERNGTVLVDLADSSKVMNTDCDATAL